MNGEWVPSEHIGTIREVRKDRCFYQVDGDSNPLGAGFTFEAIDRGLVHVEFI
jgi:hypothetical protein